MGRQHIQAHHRAWLSAHSWIAWEWLDAKLEEGFEVHHVDGDHSNNDPQNLVLVYNSDHKLLHFVGMPKLKVKRPRKPPKVRTPPPRRKKRDSSPAQIAQVARMNEARRLKREADTR